MSQRIPFRQSNGRYTRGSLAAIGLGNVQCPKCGGFNPWKPGIEPEPEKCGQCGTSLYCHAHRDGDCFWEHCPQLRDNEPTATGRHCPIDRRRQED